MHYILNPGMFGNQIVISKWNISKYWSNCIFMFANSFINIEMCVSEPLSFLVMSSTHNLKTLYFFSPICSWFLLTPKTVILAKLKTIFFLVLDPHVSLTLLWHKEISSTVKRLFYFHFKVIDMYALVLTWNSY